MMQQPAYESVAILHELDLGQHTLFIMSDSGIDLFAHDEPSCFAENGIHLDNDETYRLFISLQECFKREDSNKKLARSTNELAY